MYLSSFRHYMVQEIASHGYYIKQNKLYLFGYIYLKHHSPFHLYKCAGKNNVMAKTTQKNRGNKHKTFEIRIMNSVFIFKDFTIK